MGFYTNLDHTPILSNNQYINKFFEENNLNFYYPPTIIKHLKSIVAASVAKGFSAKTTDMAKFSSNHRTTIGHFWGHEEHSCHKSQIRFHIL